jgi:hypothetical protein
MNAKLQTRIKCILSKVIPDSSKLRYLSYIARLESWRKKHDESYPFFDNRYDLYDYLNSDIIDKGQINYLEFGVFKGDTMKYWTSINRHRESIFFGFDTFSGLPEDWEIFTGTTNKGTFDVGGTAPDLKDDRVSFVKGLFQDTLPAFLKTHAFASQLVIHNDSDLYSSTLYVLTRCNDILLRGSIVILDEFSSILHEFRALEDYCSSYMRDYEVLGATKSPTDYYPQIAVRMK